MKSVAAILLAFAALQQPQDSVQPPLRPSGIAAKINGEVITWDEIELLLRNVPPASRTPELRRQTLQTLAEKELFLQEARNYNIEITETQVDASVEAERKRSGFTIEEFQKYVNTVENLSFTEYRTLLRRELTIGTLMSRLATEPLRNPNPKLRLLFEFVSPEEMREYYVSHPEQFKPIRQVDLVFLSFQFQTPEERDEKVRLSESIQRRVKEGSLLLVLSYVYMDPGLMSLKNGQRMPRFTNLAFEDSPFSAETTKYLFEELKVGEMSPPRVEGNSVTTFLLQDRIVEKERSFEEAQPFIRKQIESSKRRHNQKLLRDDLLRRSFVEPPDLFN